MRFTSHQKKKPRHAGWAHTVDVLVHRLASYGLCEGSPLIDNLEPEPIRSGHVAAHLFLADAGRRNRFAGPPLYTLRYQGFAQRVARAAGFLVTYKETLILLYALALTFWIAWRDAHRRAARLLEAELSLLRNRKMDGPYYQAGDAPWRNLYWLLR